MPLGIPSPTQSLGTGLPDLAVMGTGTSVPPGLESVLEFNGIYLNNRSWIDTYLVTSMSGLEDADIRDDREVNPQSDGETPLDSYYGGRTITISGKIRAFTKDKCNDMKQALKFAFADISEEKPLIFHSMNSPDGDCLIFCKKNTPIVMSEIQEHQNVFERPFLITLRASNLRFLSIFNYQVVTRLGIADNFATDTIAQYTFISGGGSANVSGGKMNFSSTAAKTFEHIDSRDDFTDQEMVMKYTPDATFTSSRIEGRLRVNGSGDFIYARIAGDHILRIGKSISSVSTELSNSGGSPPSRTADVSYWLRVRVRGSVITVEHFTSDPRTGTPAPTHSLSYTLTGPDAIALGVGKLGSMHFSLTPGSTSWTMDDISANALDLDSYLFASVPNNGNFESQPEITFAGSMSDPTIHNDLNGESLILTGDLDGSHPITVDVQNDTMTDDLGANKFNLLDIDSDWLELAGGGDNDLRLTATNLGPDLIAGNWVVPTISVIYRHAWI